MVESLVSPELNTHSHTKSTMVRQTRLNKMTKFKYLMNRDVQMEVCTHLDPVLDLPGIVSDDECRLHDGREVNVAVALMLALELI